MEYAQLVDTDIHRDIVSLLSLALADPDSSLGYPSSFVIDLVNGVN